MCHQYLCADCAVNSWDFCPKLSDFICCPDYTCTKYQTERRCDNCIRITGAIEELGYWLARHPERGVTYDGPEVDEDSISAKSFTDSDDEEEPEKVVVKPDSPWGCQSGTTLDYEEVEETTDGNDKGKENIPPEDSEVEDEKEGSENNHREYEEGETDNDEVVHSDTDEAVPAAVRMEWA